MKIIIVLMFINSSIRGIKKALFEWEINGGSEKEIYHFFDIGFDNGYFTPILILLIPIVGIFLNKKIGWFLIISYLYYVVMRAIFLNTTGPYDNSFNISLILFGILVFIPFIILMNFSKIHENIYGLEKRNLIWNNIIGTIIGITLNLIII